MDRKGARSVHIILALLITVGVLLPVTSFAQSADVEAKIARIDTDKLTITLDDGKNYEVPEEFNFGGLATGQTVVVFYTVVDGRRIVDDLQVSE
ncbi:DUF1344 domain-containing protein [Rhizobiaceae bacterium BDR2-2]|uniref:DUF1344 domain-containing protein n=1 Tax=Ectorhizobium quercum TaxID=2965071 RepID=A0AAE3SWB1_9HYPH|nr:DUF1344 domain-containing protein [Ectorhizobium quercum]MCX8996373.1 DUF1344 domain-containing protein [Ectorhizobium quercum]MCX8998588.1 DUF1344 domain-containing protein [Ectorhizobium quercum]